MEGSGKFLVTAVGVHSQAGIIFTLLGATEGTGLEGMDGAPVTDVPMPPSLPLAETATAAAASTVKVEKASARTPLLNQNSEQRIGDGIASRVTGANPSREFELMPRISNYLKF